MNVTWHGKLQAIMYEDTQPVGWVLDHTTKSWASHRDIVQIERPHVRTIVDVSITSIEGLTCLV